MLASMLSITSRRRLPDVVVQVAIIVIGFVVAAAVAAPTAFLGSFGLLIATGLALGFRHQVRPRTLGIGSAIGALLVYAWTVARDGPPEAAGLRNGASSAFLIGLILAGAFVVPGYLFGRAYRRSEGASARVDEAPDLGAHLLEAPRIAVRVGVLILAADVALILWYVNTMSNMGP